MEPFVRLPHLLNYGHFIDAIASIDELQDVRIIFHADHTQLPQFPIPSRFSLMVYSQVERITQILVVSGSVSEWESKIGRDNRYLAQVGDQAPS